METTSRPIARFIPPASPDFEIQDEEQEQRFHHAVNGPFIPFCSLDFAFLNRKGWGDEIYQCLDRLGWIELVITNYDVYPSLLIEFYTTVKHIINSNHLEFTLNRMPVQLTYEYFQLMFPWRINGENRFDPKIYNAKRFWHDISSDPQFDKNNLRSSFIQDTKLFWIHRFIVQNFTSKKDMNKLTFIELRMLYCIHNHMEFDLPHFIWKYWTEYFSRYRGKIGIGWLVTLIAQRLNEDILKDLYKIPRILLGEKVVKDKYFGQTVTNMLPQAPYHVEVQQAPQIEQHPSQQANEEQQEPTMLQLFAQNIVIQQQMLERLNNLEASVQRTNQQLNNLEAFARYACHMNDWPYPPPAPPPGPSQL